MATATREIILRTLRTKNSCTVKELAEAAHVSPVSVRHHLTNLQSEQFVEVEEVRHGVGRPLHKFSLTEEALELFPTKYFRLTNRLLDQIQIQFPQGAAEDLFQSIGATMAQRYSEELAELSLEAKLNRLTELLAEEGFEAEVELADGQVFIREMSCPYYRIGSSHPEVCMVDQEFIANLLDLPIERVKWIMNGDEYCTFKASIPNTNGGDKHG